MVGSNNISGRYGGATLESQHQAQGEDSKITILNSEGNQEVVLNIEENRCLACAP
jgi:hypothetical protein